ncbi:MAG: signal peptidase II [Clostridia bacterium]|nr:signal peptidase II [Clostridia bacterium]
MKEKRKNQTLKMALVLFALLFLIDQIVKIMVIYFNVNNTIIKDILSFRLVYNKGIAFGIGQQTNMITFIISNLIVLGIIIRFIYLQKDRMDAVTMYGLFLVLAGGIGNFVDRIFRTQVVDFIEIFPKIHFPVFNLADIYIVFGWVILAFSFAMYTYKEMKIRKKQGSR